MVRAIENGGGAEINNTPSIDTRAQVEEVTVARNEDAGADSLRGEFFLRESVFRFRFQPTPTPPPVAPAIDDRKVDEAVRVIHEKLDESGIFNDVTHSELEDIEQTINGLNSEEATAVFNQLSDADLKKWADELDSGGWFGTGGFDGEGKQRLFDMLAGKLDGQNLARFATALGGEDTKKLSEAIAAHGSDATKEGFVRAAASRAETEPDTALAVAKVLASMKNNPVALQRTLGALTQAQVDNIVEAATQERVDTNTSINPFGGPASTLTITYDAAPLGELLDAVASVRDPKLKAMFFEPAARRLKEIEEAGGGLASLGAVYFKGDSVKQIRDGLTAIINSDTNGVVSALETMPDSYTGKGLTAYLKSMLGDGQEKQIGEFVSRMLLGNDLKGNNAVEHFREREPGTGGESFYNNAENLGYFLGGVQAATKQITDDVGKQADSIKNIFGAVLGAVGAAGTGPGVAAAGLNWLSAEVVNGVAARVKDGKTSISDALIQLGVPRVDSGTVYDGPAEDAFKASFSFVVNNN